MGYTQKKREPKTHLPIGLVSGCSSIVQRLELASGVVDSPSPAGALRYLIRAIPQRRSTGDELDVLGLNAETV